MKIEIYHGQDGEGEHIATFTVNGLDEIASSELLKKEGVTKPRVTLSFELSRSGILLLNKAEAKVEETYYVDAPKPKKSSSNATSNETDANNTESTQNETKPEKI